MNTATSNEKFLDTLVTRTVLEISGLRLLKDLNEEEMPKAFLSALGPSTALDYIQDTLEGKLADSNIPDGELYVMTPDHYFKYKKNGPLFSTSHIDPYDIGAVGTLEELYPKLERATKFGGDAGKLNSINVLFFNNESKMRFHASTIPAIFKFATERKINIPQYSGVKMYIFRA